MATSTAAPSNDQPSHGTSRMLHPVAMMLLIILIAIGLTYVLDSGEFQRHEKLVVPGTFHLIDKDRDLSALVNPNPPKSTAEHAYPASIFSAVSSIPVGLTKSAQLVFMVMFIGGMFGVLRKSGALDAGIDRLLNLTKGNVYILTPVLMLAIACGSTFLGLVSEYLVIIPMMLILAKRLNLGPLFATALVAIAAKIGYLASVTNPLALVIAQPIVGVPLLSGAGLRLIIFVLYLVIGIAYLLLYVKRTGYTLPTELNRETRLSAQHLMVLAIVAISIVMLIIGTSVWHWGDTQLGAFYIFEGMLIACVARMSMRIACEAFVDGMKGMMLAALLIGLAKAVEIILHDSLVLDTVINHLAGIVEGRSRIFAAEGMVFIQMVLDVLIPSTSGKAAISMPILGPIGHLSGVSGQSVVLAFLFGNGLTNMITPTSGMLLAYLATGRVNYTAWLRFILPLFAILTVCSIVIMAIAVETGY
ncbi:YfcC family protein [Glaciimonas soli]|uniref:YfcC family protein n=1 Tax=Glaciimonas soli TaxID=2590999 RepID=A0A843YWN7_9BURK|nr:SLC13 family permease [Glaciimonas soli]MQR02397.1 YfcC family protein [Glaciimonas soli]